MSRKHSAGKGDSFRKVDKKSMIRILKISLVRKTNDQR